MASKAKAKAKAKPAAPAAAPIKSFAATKEPITINQRPPGTQAGRGPTNINQRPPGIGLPPGRRYTSEVKPIETGKPKVGAAKVFTKASAVPKPAAPKARVVSSTPRLSSVMTKKKDDDRR